MSLRDRALKGTLWSTLEVWGGRVPLVLTAVVGDVRIAKGLIDDPVPRTKVANDIGNFVTRRIAPGEQETVADFLSRFPDLLGHFVQSASGASAAIAAR